MSTPARKLSGFGRSGLRGPGGAALAYKRAGALTNFKIKLAGWTGDHAWLKTSCYQRGWKSCQIVRKQPAPEHFHEWRRHVKDLWYYICLLHPVCPAATRTLADDLELLGEQLGEDHDLFLLQEFVAQHCPAQVSEAKKLNRLIGARQKKLRAAALKLGSRLYAETPAAFCRRLGESRR